MLIIPGILASSSLAEVGNFDSIATVTVGAGGQTTITFSSIPSTYKHLQLRYIARQTGGGAGGASIFMKINSDAGNNYAQHILYGTGASAAAGASTSRANISYQLMASNGDTASIFGAGVTDFLDYQNTNKYKTIRSINGLDLNNTSGQLWFVSGLWQNTNAISQLDFTAETGNFAQYSTFALYGVK